MTKLQITVRSAVTGLTSLQRTLHKLAIQEEDAGRYHPNSAELLTASGHLLDAISALENLQRIPDPNPYTL